MSRHVCRFVLLASIAALIPATAAAQTRQATYPWNVGVTAGVTMSSLHTKDDVDLDSIWGAVGGLFANKKFDRNFGVQIEALASQRGAKAENGPTLRLTYIDVPVLLRWGNTTTNRTHFHVFAGLTPAFRIKDDPKRLTSDISGETKGFDLGLPLGVAIENGAWTFDARYTLGLIDVNDGGAAIKNRSAMFKIGYRMN